MALLGGIVIETSELSAPATGVWSLLRSSALMVCLPGSSAGRASFGKEATSSAEMPAYFPST